MLARTESVSDWDRRDTIARIIRPLGHLPCRWRRVETPLNILLVHKN